MSSQTTMDHLSTGVDQLNISDKRSPEYTYSNGMLFFSPDTMTRDYILSHQPWDSDALPQQYVPTGKQRWFPPMFYLGVPLTTEEAIHFARHLGVLRGKVSRSRRAIRMGCLG
ncbi:hypothetical protein BJ322DRAFT_284350 [Thelephora terrestris]|uniref:Uncharacterized protein n=1 Tax=Thelephora terrestris TaxID=56493 RepID=A0A9P6H6Z7_9AGAM|nr:hypothetical protein BJ322DRAFT_284350 [Thelephora terrestris]